MRITILTLSMFSLLLPLDVLAAQPGMPAVPSKQEDPYAIPPGAVYRFTTKEGRLVMSNTLPQEAIYTGYDVIDPSGRLYRSVPPAIPEEKRAAERERLREEMKRKDEEQKLLRLYATPEDAVRARDRQMDTLKLNIDYATSTLTQTEASLEHELADAAKFESKGMEVPEGNRQAIEQLERQIADLNREIEENRQGLVEAEETFDPIIKRLEDIVARRNK